MSAGASATTTSAILVAKLINASFLATKSVSALTSTIPPTLSDPATTTSPSAAARPDFLAAADSPFLRKKSTALSKSPAVSVRAFLQSIIPAPVLLRNWATKDAEIFAIDQISCALYIVLGHTPIYSDIQK